VADQTSASIDIAARPDEMMAVIADFEHYPDWVDSMKSAEVLSFVDGTAKTVRMVLDHTLLKDDYVLAYEWKPQAVSWTLLEGKSAQGHGGLIPVEGQWRQNNGDVHLDR
jgi:ribosome-associated toxin RatA of RatAB toxin-antitoxin module